MAQTESDSDDSSNAEDLFAQFIARRESGEAIEIEEFCKEHPAHAAALRQYLADWERVQGVIGRLGILGPLSSRLKQEFGPDAGTDISLHGEEEGHEDFTSTVLNRLSNRIGSYGRYKLKGRIAKGGMGEILRVWDEDLRRNLAMKVILGKDGAKMTGKSTPVSTRTLGRFLEEAQVTGQLDHPGIVPVHELGLDNEGQVYFTMKLVKGHDLRHIFGLVHREQEGWTQTRALRVLLKVCEAMAYAHDKGVVHRDLKPANIMVGKFGAVYVMDWGLARVEGRVDSRDLRLDPATISAHSVVHTDLQKSRESDTDSPILTMEGTVVGTPSYMSPEQAEGRAEELGPRSDVYSLGAMLYELLTGQAPYVPSGVRIPPHVILAALLHGPPRPVHAINAHVSAELAAVCEKAMARDPADRYDDTMQIAQDLEAFLGHRPVSALPTKLGHRMNLWVKRNRALAAAIVVSLGVVSFFVYSQQVALGQKTVALDENESLVHFLSGPALITEADALYPMRSETVAAMESWLARVDALLGVESAYENELELAGGVGDSDRSKKIGELLEELKQLHVLRARVAGCMDVARNLQSDTIDDPAEAWNEAIADVEGDPDFTGSLTPQLGLVPLARNPAGYWEFWHVPSGSRPVEDPDTGEMRLNELSGMVLVLVPGGAFTIGAREDDPDRQPIAQPHVVTLKPFFISKYETTQAQWVRIMGQNPSGTVADKPATGTVGGVITWIHPVELVSWFECDEFASRLDLELPTEAQWEFACRAWTETPFSWGQDHGSLEGNENVGDLIASESTGLPTTATWRDGYLFHAPVGTFAPNGFGLYDMHGNVSEWCRDWDQQKYPPDSDEPGDGLMPSENTTRKAFRGGSWYLPPSYCPSSFRQHTFPRTMTYERGVRLARAVRESPGTAN